MKKIGCFFGIIFLLFFSFVTFWATSSALAQDYDVVDTLEEEEVFIYQGDLVALRVYSLTRIAITKPGFVDIANADVDEILLVGKRVGETTFFVWDEHGKRKITIRVIEQDLNVIIERIQRLLASAEIEGIEFERNDYEGKILVSGTILTEKKEDFDKLIAPFGGQIINLVKEAGELIQVDVQVSELTESLSKTLGFNWSVAALSYTEDFDSLDLDGSIGSWFKIGKFNRTTEIATVINFLLLEGKGRVLSKPRVIVNDGQSSSFQVGGEIPVPTTTSTDGGSIQENVSYRSYGVNVSVTPKIIGEKVEVQLTVSVSDIDSANAVGSNTAFTTTSTNTKMTLDDGQTVILAGLIKHNTSETVGRIPVLSAIPIVGALFRYKNIPDSEKEIVISLTPKILRSEKKETEEEAVDETESLSEEEEDIKAIESAVEVDPEESLESTGQEQESTIEENSVAGLEETEAQELADEALVSENDEKETSPEAKAYEKLQMEQMPSYDGDLSKAITEYAKNIQQKISAGISYPFEAREKGWKGTVKLKMVVLSDGTLFEIELAETSGYDIFDKDALNTAQISAPFEPFPAEIDLEELTITIPIIYSQKDI